MKNTKWRLVGKRSIIGPMFTELLSSFWWMERIPRPWSLAPYFRNTLFLRSFQMSTLCVCVCVNNELLKKFLMCVLGTMIGILFIIPGSTSYCNSSNKNRSIFSYVNSLHVILYTITADRVGKLWPVKLWPSFLLYIFLGRNDQYKLFNFTNLRI